MVSAAPARADQASSAGASYLGITPARVLDANIDARWTHVNVAGTNGIPATGVTAVVATVTVVSGTDSGFLTAIADDQPDAMTTSVLTWNGAENISNTAVLPLSAGGAFKVFASNGVRASIDIQGYYQVGTSTAGFFVTPTTRVLDTRPDAAPIPAGSERVVMVGGVDQIPTTGVSAVFANISVVSRGGTSGELITYAAGAARPSAGLHYEPGAGNRTSLGVIVPVSQSGQLAVYLRSDAPAHVVIDIQGYYSADGSVFTPASGVLVPGNAVNPMQPAQRYRLAVSGNATLPSVVTGLTAVALVITASTSSAADADIRLWSTDGTPEPFRLFVGAGERRSIFVITVPGADESVFVQVNGNPVVLDIAAAGYFSPARPAEAALADGAPADSPDTGQFGGPTGNQPDTIGNTPCTGLTERPHESTHLASVHARTNCPIAVPMMVSTNLERDRWYGWQYLANGYESKIKTSVDAVAKWPCWGTGTYTYRAVSYHRANIYGRTAIGYTSNSWRFYC
jgi:hypothetical protein